MKTIPQPALHIALSGGVEMAFCRIPAGGFLMGARGEFRDEEPQHRVLVDEPFFLAVYPVTQAQFAVWTQSEAYERWLATAITRKLLGDWKRHENHFKDKPNHPAECVAWHEAMGFCNWINGERGCFLPPDYKATLPGEAQWEYACRGPDTSTEGMNSETEYYTGDGDAALAEAGWYDGNSENRTHPVGGKKANGWGLHDMHGNAVEWCGDVYDAKAYRKRIDGWEAWEWTSVDAGGDAELWSEEARKQKGPQRVLRGGSWLHSARRCRSAYRSRDEPDYRDRYIGFRVCLVPGQVEVETETASQAEPAPGDGGRRMGPDSEGAGAARADATRFEDEIIPAQRIEQFC